MSSAQAEAIRELYLAASSGPLRVKVRDALPPLIAAGDTVRLERLGPEGLRRGDAMGVKTLGRAVRLLRYLGRDEGGAVLGVVRGSLFRIKPEMVLGRAVAVESEQGERQLAGGSAGTLDSARLGVEELGGRFGEWRERLALKRYLTRLYWDVNDSFVQGTPETGDILVTDRCPVGCRFCLYSCVVEGHDMEPEQITRTARGFRAAGVPRVRILGGEPFISLELALDSFQAVAAVYPAERISMLSSGHWGGTPELVRSRLDPVVAAGLRSLALSFDSFHIERFPVDNYERILQRTSQLGVDTVLSVHYSSALRAELPRLLELKRRYPFSLKLMTVSREGRAQLLDDAELNVAGVMDFRRALLEEPGVEIRMEDSNCFRWTAFPDGELSFCCKQHPKNVVGNLRQQPMAELNARLKRAGNRNRLRVLDFAVRYGGELSWNPCLSCPLGATAEGPILND